MSLPGRCPPTAAACSTPPAIIKLYFVCPSVRVSLPSSKQMLYSSVSPRACVYACLPACLPPSLKPLSLSRYFPPSVPLSFSLSLLLRLHLCLLFPPHYLFPLSLLQSNQSYKTICNFTNLQKTVNPRGRNQTASKANVHKGLNPFLLGPAGVATAADKGLYEKGNDPPSISLRCGEQNHDLSCEGSFSPVLFPPFSASLYLCMSVCPSSFPPIFSPNLYPSLFLLSSIPSPYLCLSLSLLSSSPPLISILLSSSSPPYPPLISVLLSFSSPYLFPLFLFSFCFVPGRGRPAAARILFGQKA